MNCGQGWVTQEPTLQCESCLIFPFCHNSGVWVIKNRPDGGDTELTTRETFAQGHQRAHVGSEDSVDAYLLNALPGLCSQ